MGTSCYCGQIKSCHWYDKLWWNNGGFGNMKVSGVGLNMFSLCGFVMLGRQKTHIKNSFGVNHNNILEYGAFAFLNYIYDFWISDTWHIPRKT